MAIAPIPNKNCVIRQYDIAAAGDVVWPEGALLTLVAGELTQLTGADPAQFLGFAVHAVPLSPNDILSGFAQVYLAYPGSTFWMSGDRNPLITDEGVEYGVSYDANGVPQVDTTDTTNDRFFVERVDLLRNLFEVTVLDAARIAHPAA